MSTSVQLLGQPQIRSGTEVIRLPAGKGAALLYYLAFRHDWLTRDELALLFWPDADERTARTNLRTLLSTFRHLPFVTLEADATRVRWLVASDVQRFNAAYERGDRAAAVAAYTGLLLQGVQADLWPDFGEWLEHTRLQLVTRFTHEALALATIYEHAGRKSEALTVLARVLELEPLHEPTVRAYLRLLHTTGHPHRVNAAFETFAQTLRDTVGGEPQPETAALMAQLEVTALNPAPVPHNLPALRTSFVGRAFEKAALSARLNDPACRLLTVVGPGGVGKTRLALEVAGTAIGSAQFADGVFFIPLATVTTADLLLPSVAEKLGLGRLGTDDQEAQLGGYLKDKALLLVLDNLEQLTGAVTVVADLLDSSPRLKLLLTSREALGVYGEYEYLVPALSLPDRTNLPAFEDLRRYEAVEVFVQRAQAVKPDFALTPENAHAIVEICHKLDGLPLALELAAARSRLFSPQALVTRLGRRLQLLSAGARNLPLRQQTLRDAIGWSYELLSAAEKTLFRQLSVFVGSCSLDAIDAVCTPDGETLDMTDSLVRKNLVKQLPDEDGEPRLFMLETIQEFAAEQHAQSGEADALQQRFCRYYLTLAETSDTALRGPEQARWLRRLEAEHDNLPRGAAVGVRTRARAGSRAGRHAVSFLGFAFVAKRRPDVADPKPRPVSGGVARTPCQSPEHGGRAGASA